jgi:glutamate-5-semialdehyde dehydrogenase
MKDTSLITKEISHLCRYAKESSYTLSNTTNIQRNFALESIAKALIREKDKLLSANRLDISEAEEKNISVQMIERLKLDDDRIFSMVKSLHEVAKQKDPLGKILWKNETISGLRIRAISVPLGVIAVIYESRPNVTLDAAGLCLKSGNSVILRGGSEAKYSNRKIVDIIHQGLENTCIPQEVIQFVGTQDRNAIKTLVSHDGTIDVVIPRGGRNLINYLIKYSKIPLFKHLDGICHTYIHQDASAQKALDVTLNAKMRRTSICGATETILIDNILNSTLLQELLKILSRSGCEVRLDDQLQKNYPNYKIATEHDWKAEYLDSIVSIRAVDTVDQAISHINHYGSHHTDSIITENSQIAHHFMKNVDSAVVMHNTSTQFSDGGEFGMGSEIGIATGKLHARGPIGSQQLTTFKYHVVSDGATRAN